MAQKNETGRSMVEMIAVLALVGVITVGGMTGYLTALKKNQSNNILELVATMSIYAQSHAKPIGVESGRITGVSKILADYPCLSDITGFANGSVQVNFKTTDGCPKIRELSAGAWGSMWNNATNTYTPSSEY